MEATKLREKLKAQFSEIIEDDRNLDYLEKIFGIINGTGYTSQVPESHYEIVDERRRKLIAGETIAEDWDIVKEGIKKKHGF